MAKKQKVLTPEQVEEIRTKDFFDCILPSTIKFFSDHYIVGDSYRSVWAIREYPPSTEEQAILSQLADRNGVTLRTTLSPIFILDTLSPSWMLSLQIQDMCSPWVKMDKQL